MFTNTLKNYLDQKGNFIYLNKTNIEKIDF